MNAERVLRHLVAGLPCGTIHAVVGVGFDVIRGTTGIIDFAQGELVTLGGTAAVTLHGLVPLSVAIVPMRPGEVARLGSA